MKGSIAMALFVVLAQGGGGGIIAGVQDTVDGAIDFADGIVDAAMDLARAAGNIAGGLLGGGTTNPAAPSGGGYGTERVYLEGVANDLESTANSNPENWVVKDGMKQYDKFNVVVVKQGVAIDKYKVSVDYENKTLNITQGQWKDADITVFPKYADVKYIDKHYEKYLNGNVGSAEATRLWAIWKNTGCKPKKACNEVRSKYVDLWETMIGRFTGDGS